MAPPGRLVALVVALGAGAIGCGGTLDAGRDRSHGPLPVDERNPVILDQDDWSGDWLGEYAVMLANSGGPPLAGIIVNKTPFWGDVNANAMGWNNLLAAASMSGLKNLPVVTPSPGDPLTRPADGQIESTVANDTAGARLMRDVSQQLSTPTRPVVIVVTTSFTDLANAYFLDRTIVNRVVVVAAAGSYQAPNGVLDRPNGDMDPWADWIVTQRYTFVDVGTWYDQTGDITDANVMNLPMNPFGMWISKKRSQIIDIDTASDQVALLSFGLPMFTTSAVPASPDISAGFNSAQGPNIVPDPNGKCWLVTGIVGARAGNKLWDMLLTLFPAPASP